MRRNTCITAPMSSTVNVCAIVSVAGANVVPCRPGGGSRGDEAARVHRGCVKASEPRNPLVVHERAQTEPARDQTACETFLSGNHLVTIETGVMYPMPAPMPPMTP